MSPMGGKMFTNNGIVFQSLQNSHPATAKGEQTAQAVRHFLIRHFPPLCGRWHWYHHTPIWGKALRGLKMDVKVVNERREGGQKSNFR